MLSFETDLHGPDEEVGLYQAKVLYDYNDEQGAPDVINVKVTIFKLDSIEKKEISTLAITYDLTTREYKPLLGAETNMLYGSVILMLEETLGSSWGYETN